MLAVVFDRSVAGKFKSFFFGARNTLRWFSFSHVKFCLVLKVLKVFFLV